MIIGNIESITAINDTLLNIQKTQDSCKRLTNSFSTQMLNQLALLQTWYNSSLDILQKATLYQEVMK